MKIGAPHTFHIPVMGLAYTIDTPVKVARFGIDSVISIIEDNLVEKMRAYYYHQLGENYFPITSKDSDYRARRITDYLDVINRIVHLQVEEMRQQPFQAGSDINNYFDWLPERNPLKEKYKEMDKAAGVADRIRLENELRASIVPGSIDANIMTKLDKNNKDKTGHPIPDGSDAVAALRGYANSKLRNSSIILSAGMNPRLFNYMESQSAFDPDVAGNFDKKIVIKVSDYRSALIQGKMLAKKGLWVSEFRIESGLNCGGHAFATDGYLIGPILEEFKDRRQELTATLHEIYSQAIRTKGKPGFERAHALKISVQGGIGSHEEDTLLHTHYRVDSTGWGTPFLLVPEVTNVDAHTLRLLQDATESDVVLSKNSPLGVRFHYLKGTTGEIEKMERIQRGTPGSPCTEKFLVSNTEFTTEPICTASHAYQKRKIEQLQSLNLSEAEYKQQLQAVVDKECLCIGLSNAVIKTNRLNPFKGLEAVNICPGPNIAYFSQVVSLKKMLDHIYGRGSVLTTADRPHMFIKELNLYVDYWKELVTDVRSLVDQKQQVYIKNFHANLIHGIGYYRTLSDQLEYEMSALKAKLAHGLNEAEDKLNSLLHNYLATPIIT